MTLDNGTKKMIAELKNLMTERSKLQAKAFPESEILSKSRDYTNTDDELIIAFAIEHYYSKLKEDINELK